MSGDDTEPSADIDPQVRVRGIYSTAITQLLLEAEYTVVGVSEPIDRRFDESFPAAGHEVAVETTPDRQGISVEGEKTGVATVSETIESAVGKDVFLWPDPTPRGSVFYGRVSETLGNGAVVDLTVGIQSISDTDMGSPEPDSPTGGPMTTDHLSTEGYLPFDTVEDHVSVGDEYLVQIAEPAPPWASNRPEVDTTIRAFGGVATLERGLDRTVVDTHDDEAARELAGMTELLSLEPPEGWGLRWTHAATGVEMGALETGLERAVHQAEILETALTRFGNEKQLTGDSFVAQDVATHQGQARAEAIAAPLAGTWIWFGRESRFHLDERRRRVTITMPGHHRIKAGSAAAATGVDFVEHLCNPDSGDEFPFGVVTEQFGPQLDDEVRIHHGKPDGRLITLGTGKVTDIDDEGNVTVERTMTGRGTYDGLGVDREQGDIAVTKFREGRWWYPTTYRDDSGSPKGTYVNVCTPVECFPDTIRYVDLHVDVIKHRDGTIERVDDAELDQAVDAGRLSEPLADKARSVATALENAL